MKQLYSILKVSDPIMGGFDVAVCETLQAEKDAIRKAEFSGRTVTTVIAPRKWYTAFVHIVRDSVSLVKFSH